MKRSSNRRIFLKAIAALLTGGAAVAVSKPQVKYSTVYTNIEIIWVIINEEEYTCFKIVHKDKSYLGPELILEPSMSIREGMEYAHKLFPGEILDVSVVPNHKIAILPGEINEKKDFS